MQTISNNSIFRIQIKEKVMNLSMQAVFILNQLVFILKNIKQLEEIRNGATVIMSNYCC